MSRADRRARKKANTAVAREERYAGWRRTRRRRWVARVLVLLLVAALVGGAAFALVGGDDDEAADDTTSTSAGPTTTTTLPAELAAVECRDDEPENLGEEKAQFDAPPEMQVDPAKTYRATMATTCGDIVVELDPSIAPNTVNSFVFLSREGFFDGLTFHRVVSDFVIQGGDPTGSGSGGPGYQFDDELPTDPYALGDLAMANSGPNTNGSQWFVITGQQGTSLPPSYSKFGRVVEGLDVAQRLEKFETPGTQAPSRPIYIFSVTIEEA